MWRIGHAEVHYRQMIQSFLDNKEAFNAFKREKLYASVIGAPSIFQAGGFWTDIQKNSAVMQKLSEFKKMDTIGGPWLYDFKEHKLSLNLIRYLSTICLLQEAFGSLDNFEIQEVGAGYGGLAHCIQTMWNPSRYCIVDLPEAQELAVRHSFLLNHKVEKGMCPFNIDLAIAEYSISEQDTIEPIIAMTDKYLMNAKRIFVRFNHVDETVRNAWLRHIKTKFDVKVKAEKPDLVLFNKIVIGQSHQQQ